MKIQELSITDYKVLSTEYKETKTLKICVSGSYDIKEHKNYKDTIIYITEWSMFLIKIFNSDMKQTILNVMNMETFEYIQEIEFINKQLILKGFSNESGGWLIYEFDNPQIDIFFQ